MARFKWVQHPKTGELIPAGEYYSGERVRTAAVQQDTMSPLWHPAKDMITDSKSEFRRWTKEAGCVEIGNESVRGTYERHQKEQQAKRDARRHEVVARTVNDIMA